MEITAIRARVTQALEEEQASGHLASVLLAGPGGAPGPARDILEFLRGYLVLAVDVLEAAVEAARVAELLPRAAPLFDSACAYWEQRRDFVPDAVGVLGLSDDAYLSNALLERADMIHHGHTGRRLLSVGLAESNAAMRGLLGEPMVGRLDELVSRALELPEVLRACEAFRRWGGTLDLRLPGREISPRYFSGPVWSLMQDRAAAAQRPDAGAPGAGGRRS